MVNDNCCPVGEKFRIISGFFPVTDYKGLLFLELIINLSILNKGNHVCLCRCLDIWSWSSFEKKRWQLYILPQYHASLTPYTVLDFVRYELWVNVPVAIFSPMEN